MDRKFTINALLSMTIKWVMCTEHFDWQQDIESVQDNFIKRKNCHPSLLLQPSQAAKQSTD